MGGRLVAERYRLEEQVGAGGMGIVWRATDLELGRTVALKKSQSGDGGQIRREARIGAGLQHPNVVSVYDAVTYEDDRWLVMEYLPSRSLATILETDGVLSHEEAARIGVQLANALSAMHDKGIVHRDIKPSNVLVAEDGTAKLTDLGIAQWAEVTRTESGLVGGTPAYLAPEVADGLDATKASDVFSLGATLFAAVEGGSPWGDSEDTPLRQLRRAAAFQLEAPRKPGALTPVLTELMSKQAARRPSAHEAARLLAEVAGATVPEQRAPRRGRRRLPRRVLVGGALALVALLVAGLLFAFRDGAVTAATVGDQRTADPCSLLDPVVLAKFGPVSPDPDYGNFNGCEAHIKRGPEKGNLVDVRVAIELPGELPPPPKLPEPGHIGIPERPPAKDEKCERIIWLPDGNQVKLVVKHNSGNWFHDLCGIAEPVVDGALKVLNRGQIPRRQQPPAKGSLQALDACALVSGEESSKELGGRATMEAGYGNWTCYWTSQNRQLTVEFNREWAPLEADEGTRETIGGREVYVKGGDQGWEEGCKAEIAHRPFTGAAGSLSEHWVETVMLHVEQRGTEGSTHCGVAKAVAAMVAARLPAI
ncbi:Serine/threonine protein kinase [Amycolatopsis xylanica]|uniref:Serine/threonine protein kinase n=1 Tax=Amycolatopsis xylanica TaxID=589385 RepID=A0A1H3DJ01_9PSEU|nr:serine/threonine-protein kinase [Amycolatopsis xylanica]SDX66492.1 Serine/threonine protein kinase [Amycolatopsis xylanica]